MVVEPTAPQPNIILLFRLPRVNQPSTKVLRKTTIYLSQNK